MSWYNEAAAVEGQGLMLRHWTKQEIEEETKSLVMGDVMMKFCIKLEKKIVNMRKEVRLRVKTLSWQKDLLHLLQYLLS